MELGPFRDACGKMWHSEEITAGNVVSNTPKVLSTAHVILCSQEPYHNAVEPVHVFPLSPMAALIEQVDL